MMGQGGADDGQASGGYGCVRGGRSPMAMAGGGASGVPIQRNLLNVYPNREL